MFEQGLHQGSGPYSSSLSLFLDHNVTTVYEYFYSPPGWGACSLWGYSQALNLLVPIYTSGWGEAM